MICCLGSAISNAQPDVRVVQVPGVVNTLNKTIQPSLVVTTCASKTSPLQVHLWEIKYFMLMIDDNGVVYDCNEDSMAALSMVMVILLLIML